MTDDARLADLRRGRGRAAQPLARDQLDPTLDRIEAFMEVLGDPQRTYPSIHLTGTNGKTSTAG